MLHWIAADYFARSPVLALPVLGLVLCILVFVSAALRALRTPRGEIERLAQLPLEQASEVEDV